MISGLALLNYYPVYEGKRIPENIWTYINVQYGPSMGNSDDYSYVTGADRDNIEWIIPKALCKIHKLACEADLVFHPLIEFVEENFYYTLGTVRDHILYLDDRFSFVKDGYIVMRGAA